MRESVPLAGDFEEVMTIHYNVRVKKPANRKTSENTGATVNMARLKYITGMEDLRQASKETIEERIQENLREGIELDPEYALYETEHVVVIPNPRIGQKKRRLGKAIYNDEMDIPAEVIKRHREKRQRRGYGSTST